MTPLQTTFLPPTNRIPPLSERKALLAKLKSDVSKMEFVTDKPKTKKP